MTIRTAKPGDEIPDGQNKFDVARNDFRRGYGLSGVQRLKPRRKRIIVEVPIEYLSLLDEVSGSDATTGVTDVKETLPNRAANEEQNGGNN